MESKRTEKLDEVLARARALAGADSVASVSRALELLSEYPDSPEGDKIAKQCVKRLMVLQARERQQRRETGKKLLLLALYAGAVAFLLFGIIRPGIKYSSAVKLQQQGNYTEAAEIFRTVSGFGDSESRAAECDEAAALEGSYSSVHYEDFDTSGLSPDAEGDSSRTAEDTGVTPAGSGQLTDAAAVSGGYDPGSAGSGSSGTGADSSLHSSERGELSAEDGGDNSPSDGASLDYGANTASGAEESGISDSGEAEGLSSAKGTEDAGSVTAVKNRVQVSDSRWYLYISLGLILSAGAVLLYRKYLRFELQYRRAVKLINEGSYSGAIELLTAIGGYRDSAGKIAGCELKIKDGRYEKAIELKASGDYTSAIEALSELKDYRDSTEQIEDCSLALKEQEYVRALRLFEEHSFSGALEAFEALGDYRDSEKKVSACKRNLEKLPAYENACALQATGELKEAEEAFRLLPGFMDSDARRAEILADFYAGAEALLKAERYEEAQAAFISLKNYRDSEKRAAECRLAAAGRDIKRAAALSSEGRYEDALDILRPLSGLPEAEKMQAEIKSLIVLPRPFDRLSRNMTEESARAVLGEPAGIFEEGDRRELSYEEVLFMDLAGTLKLSFSAGLLSEGHWTAFFGKSAGSGQSRRKTPERFFSAVTKYYVSLFGKQDSGFNTGGHNVIWWTAPHITVDCCRDEYVSVTM